MFIGRTDAKAEIPVLWPPHVKSWLIGKDSDAGRDWGQEEKRTTGWDGWMASPTRWTWVWVNSGSWWWTGRPGMLQFMGLQRVGHDWATELTDWLTEAELRRSFFYIFNKKWILLNNLMLPRINTTMKWVISWKVWMIKTDLKNIKLESSYF